MLGALIGGIFGANAAKKQKAELNKQERANQQWYDRRYNEDATQRADALAALTRFREGMNAQMAATRGQAAVAGGATGSQVAMQKQAAANAMGDVVSNIAEAGEKRKDGIEATWQAKNDAISNKRMDIEQKRADQIAAAGAQLDSAIYKTAGAMINPASALQK